MLFLQSELLSSGVVTMLENMANEVIQVTKLCVNNRAY